jgi:hypothetical protein
LPIRNKKNIFNKIIVGSGPSAMGYLAGIDSIKGKNLLISNDSIYVGKVNLKKIHPKLYRKNNAFINVSNKSIVESNNFGGLSSSWGGLLGVPSLQKIKKLSKYKKNSDVLFNAYKSILIKLNEYFKLYKLSNFNFNLIKKKSQINLKNPEVYLLCSHKKNGWENNGINIFPIIKDDCKRLAIQIKNDAISSVLLSNNLWHLKSKNKDYFAREVVLAAGAITNRRLLMNVRKEFSGISLSDHAPYKVYLFRFFKQKKINLLVDNATPVAACYIDKHYLFSFYSLNKFSTGFLLKFGFFGLILDGLPNAFKENLFLSQVWINDHKKSLFSKKINKNDISYLQLIKFFLKNGFFPLIFSETKKGEGFHYMTDTNQHKANLLLSNLKGLKVLGGFCNQFDFKENPTLSFMADAYLQSKGFRLKK